MQYAQIVAGLFFATKLSIGKVHKSCSKLCNILLASVVAIGDAGVAPVV